MSDWKERLTGRLEPLLRQLDPRPGISAYHDMPYAVFRYPPEVELALRHKLTLLRTRLQAAGKRVTVISLAECLDRALAAEGLSWPELAEAERTVGLEQAVETVHEILSAYQPLDRLVAAQLPPDPDPFEPLPVCSPGMLTGDDGLPLAAPPAGYPLAFPADGMLVDDPGHAGDLTARVREVFGVVFGEQAEAHWQEAAELVAPRDRDLRRWLAREYFGLHLHAYSKSRRRAPIYWQISTPSGSYSVWLYYHRLSRDTLYTVLNDYVTPKLRYEERRLTGVVQEVGPHPTPGQRRDIAAQEAFVEELVRVAPLWDPDLNDGVILNFAPLWRLAPQHKAWQREVKVCWDKLAAGTYDWAHQAMHLWPERVVPKCATDRSLAIAHGLEDVFWTEGDDGKCRPRSVDPATIDRLVAERASLAVRAAVAGLVEMAVGGGTSVTRRTRGQGAQ